MIPSEYLFKNSVVEEEVYRKGMEANGFREAVFETATRANDYLITARTMIKEEFGGKIPQGAVGPLVGAVSLNPFPLFPSVEKPVQILLLTSLLFLDYIWFLNYFVLSGTE